jgi:phosphomevalonate kinase
MKEFYAPGKLFLAGEYSVLAPDRPALVLAMDRGLTLFSSDAPHARIEVPRWDLDIVELARPVEECTDPREGFLRALYQATAFRCPQSGPKHLVVDATKNDLLVRDLGLGSSAAFAVNMARAFLPNEAPQSPKVLALALDSHQSIQGGHGSGADVATAWAGCSIRYAQKMRGAPMVRALKARENLCLWFMYSGTPQRTRGAVQSFQNLEKARPRFVQRFRDYSSKLVNDVQRGLDGPPNLLVGSVDRSGKLLSDLARNLGQPPPLPNLFQAALGLADAAAKPSGAIGGDCIIVAARRAHVADKVRALGAAAGFEMLNLTPVFGVQK